MKRPPLHLMRDEHVRRFYSILTLLQLRQFPGSDFSHCIRTQPSSSDASHAPNLRESKCSKLCNSNFINNRTPFIFFVLFHDY